MILFQSTEIQTEPPPRANFTDSVNQWIIFDAYTNYERLKEIQVLSLIYREL